MPERGRVARLPHRRQPKRLAPLAGLFGTSLLVGYSGALMPGTLFAAVLAGAAAGGFWVGPAIVGGHVLLELFLVVALVYGLGGVLSRPAVMRLIAAVGGLTLLWLAWGMIRDGLAQRVVMEAAAGASPAVVPGGGPAAALLGAVLSVTNPYFVLWWATAGATYVALALQQGPPGIAAFYTGHILADLSWYSLVALLVASGRGLLGPAVYNGIVVAAGAFLVVMAAVFLWTAARPAPRVAATD
jgi:threonine/homoserine/homoserine lactone efflux protein